MSVLSDTRVGGTEPYAGATPGASIGGPLSHERASWCLQKETVIETAQRQRPIQGSHRMLYLKPELGEGEAVLEACGATVYMVRGDCRLPDQTFACG